MTPTLIGANHTFLDKGVAKCPSCASTFIIRLNLSDQIPEVQTQTFLDSESQLELPDFKHQMSSLSITAETLY